MIVVSNTSPLTNLAAIGQFGLLQSLYAELHIRPCRKVSTLVGGSASWPLKRRLNNAHAPSLTRFLAQVGQDGTPVKC
jgi:hypothetical protein